MTANREKHLYRLLSGEKLSIGWLSEKDMKFLEKLKEDAVNGKDYFSLLKHIRGHNSYVLMNFNGLVTEEATQSILFKVASDIVERAGIRQGRVFRSESAPEAKNLITASQACEVMDVARSSLHFLLTNGKVKGWKIGKLWFVDRESAENYSRK